MQEEIASGNNHEANPAPINKQLEESKNLEESTELTSTKDPNQQPLLVKVENPKGWTKQELISLSALIISSLLFFMTLLTFRETAKSVAISAKSLKSSLLMDSISRNRDSMTDLRIHKSDSISDAKDSAYRVQDNENRRLSETYRIRDSISFQFYLRGIKKTDKFEDSWKNLVNLMEEKSAEEKLENIPYIQCSGFTLQQFEANKPIIIRYNIDNFGYFFARVLSLKISYGLFYNINDFKFDLKGVKGIFPNIIISKGILNVQELHTEAYFSQEQIAEIKSGKQCLVIFGEIVYLYMQNKKRVYRFEVKIRPSLGFEIQLNDTTDL